MVTGRQQVLVDLRRMQVELQSLGVQLPQPFSGRKAGAGPAEGIVIGIGGKFISVPTESEYVSQSLFRIEEQDTKYFLVKKGQRICEVIIPGRPRYYEQKTEAGISFDKIGLLHGRDCFASTVYQDCVYWNTPLACQFCGIGLSLSRNKTIVRKSADDLGRAAEKARALDGVTHVTLTTGLTKHEQEAVHHLARCVKNIKDRSGLPVHVQIAPPQRPDVLDVLQRSGADTIGIHIETFDPAVLSRIAPAKAALGIKNYIKAWEDAVAVFGRNQVSSFLIAGLGEHLSSIVEGAEILCKLGVFPYILPLRPIPGTPLGDWKPPAADDMLALYQRAGALLSRYGLSSAVSKAGCVRCGSCSAIALFEDY
jgi:radical SAM protein (TIGR04043 family)